MRIPVLVFGLLLAGCAGGMPPGSLDPETGSPEAARASVSQGRPSRSSQPINLASLPPYRHPRAEAMVRATAQELMNAAGQPNLLANVSILDDSSYNAILQGNRLYVTRGLLALMNDRSELAAIMAHEMGHALARHARSRVMARNAAIANTMDVARTFRDPEVTRVALEANQRTLAAFSRVQEHEADGIGIALMAKAGFDPKGAVRSLHAYARMQDLFRNLARISASRISSPLATHPPTPKRIALAERQVRALPVASGRNERDRFLSSIEGMHFGGDGRNGFMRGRNFFHRGRNLAMTMPAGFVPASTRLGVGGLRKGASAFLVFSPLQSNFAADPEAALKQWLSGSKAPVTYAAIPGRKGAMARSDDAAQKRRVAIVISDGKPYAVVIFAKQNYPGLENDFRTAVASVRTLSPRDLAIARPLRIDVVRAQGPQTLQRYARLNGDPDYGPQLLLALNNLTSLSQVRPGMQIKVLAPDGTGGNAGVADSNRGAPGQGTPIADR